MIERTNFKKLNVNACIHKCISSTSSVAAAASLPLPRTQRPPSSLTCLCSLPYSIMRVLNIGGRESAAMEEAAEASTRCRSLLAHSLTVSHTAQLSHSAKQKCRAVMMGKRAIAQAPLKTGSLSRSIIYIIHDCMSIGTSTQKEK